MAFYNPDRPAYRDDPYPALARLRREEPVHYSRELRAWVLTAYADCVHVLQDHDTFSSNLERAAGETGDLVASRRRAAPLGDVPVLSNSDPPIHGRLRSIVGRAFTPRVLDGMRPRIEQLVAERLAALEDPFDLMTGLAEPLVIASILELLGVPGDDHKAFQAVTFAIIMAHSGDPARLAQAQVAHVELTAMVERWQSTAAVAESSVLGAILAASAEGETVTPDEMLMLLINIALSGNGATINGIGNAVLALAGHPAAAAQLQAGDVPLDVAVDELLRFDSPAHIVTRIATNDVALGARRIHAGDVVHVVLGAANRDPARFADPGTLDLARADNRHLTFGYANHFCLGAPLARIEIESVLAALFARHGRFRIDALERGTSLLMRGPRKLVIVPA